MLAVGKPVVDRLPGRADDLGYFGLAAPLLVAPSLKRIENPLRPGLHRGKIVANRATNQFATCGLIEQQFVGFHLLSPDEASFGDRPTSHLRFIHV
jgi:hypothetical protein